MFVGDALPRVACGSRDPDRKKERDEEEFEDQERDGANAFKRVASSSTRRGHRDSGDQHGEFAGLQRMRAAVYQERLVNVRARQRVPMSDDRDAVVEPRRTPATKLLLRHQTRKIFAMIKFLVTFSLTSALVGCAVLSSPTDDSSSTATQEDYSSALSDSRESLSSLNIGATTSAEDGYCIDDYGSGGYIGYHCCSFSDGGGYHNKCCSGFEYGSPFSNCTSVPIPHTDPGHGTPSDPFGPRNDLALTDAATCQPHARNTTACPGGAR